MTVVIKLGGSLVTVKDEVETVDEAALADAAMAIGNTETDLVVVHGGGSFGHHHAADRGVSATDGTHDASDVVAIHDAMGRLNARVVDALQEEGIEAVPVRPLSVARRSRSGMLELPTGAVEGLLAEGFVPVLHGDVVVEVGAGATITSGDDLVVALAKSLSADRVGLCSTVPGVLDPDGDVIPVVERFADVADAVGASDATDVTGGMAGKVRTLLDLSTPASVFGPEGLAPFLAGEDPGTRIEGGTDPGADDEL